MTIITKSDMLKRTVVIMLFGDISISFGWMNKKELDFWISNLESDLEDVKKRLLEMEDE